LKSTNKYSWILWIIGIVSFAVSVSVTAQTKGDTHKSVVVADEAVELDASDTLQNAFAKITVQSWQVMPLENYIGIYREYRTILMNYINDQTSWDYARRVSFYKQEMDTLMTRFQTDRTAEYNSKSLVLSVLHWCSSKESGEVRNCKWRWVHSPSPELFTEKKALRVKGKQKGLKVTADGLSAGIKMTVAGKGKNQGRLYATYKYRSNVIKKNVEDETIRMRAAMGEFGAVGAPGNGSGA
jgi:hypothetical protein